MSIKTRAHRKMGEVGNISVRQTQYLRTMYIYMYFHILLLWFIDLRLWHSYIHVVISDTTSYWLACRPIRSHYAAILPAHHLPTVPSVRTQRTMRLCIVSHYRCRVPVKLCTCSHQRLFQMSFTIFNIADTDTLDFVRITELISNVCIRRLLPVDIRGEYELWRRWTSQFSKHCYRMSAGVLEQCQLYWGWLQSYAAARSKMLDEWSVVWTEKWPHIDRHHSLLPL